LPAYREGVRWHILYYHAFVEFDDFLDMVVSVLQLAHRNETFVEKNMAHLSSPASSVWALVCQQSSFNQSACVVLLQQHAEIS
jgi:hypothetical protein